MMFRILSLGLICAVPAVQARGQEVVFQQELQGEAFPVGHLLRWETASEDPGLRFFLERSSDGLTFNTFAEEQGRGKTVSRQIYQILIPDVTEPFSWYRLRVEKDDRFLRYSNVVPFRRNAPNQFAILGYSDPFPWSVFRVEIQGRVQGRLQWHLQNLDEPGTGDFGAWPLAIGINLLEIDVTSLPEGPYRLSFRLGEEEESLTIRKVRDPAIRSLTVDEARPTPRMER